MLKRGVEQMRLLGATVEAVYWEQPTEAPEAICEVKATDGKRYRLCATELGWWLEEVEREATC